MMMSKPRQVSPEESKPEAAAKKTPEDTVKDLERRLELLGGASAAAIAKEEEEAKPAAPTAAPATTVKGGKNALLARIMAAQERAKSAQVAKEAPKLEAQPDLLSEFDAPPPAFDDSLLPPATQQEEAPPPSFDVFEENNTPPPPFPAPSAPPMASAPNFEDLLDMQAPPAALDGITQAMPPPPPPPAVEEFEGLEGLSEEEKNALLEEQRKIMEQIEREKKSKETSLADAFDQRSSVAAVQALSQGGRSAQVSSRPSSAAAATPGTVVNLGSGTEASIRGQEESQAAINDGTALLVQCMTCQNWMQVTTDATLMFCPVCSTVSPVEADTNGLTRQEAMQLAADRQMAEALQNEEYQQAEGPAPRRAKPAAPAPAPAASSNTGSWWDWLTGTSTTEATSPARPTPQMGRPLARGDVGVSRPPGLSSARTGEETETVTFNRSYDEQERFIGGARIAEQKPLFSCVVDSVSTAATSLSEAMQTQTLNQDQEGNVHGVDASSLLTVTKATRNTEQPYERM